MKKHYFLLSLLLSFIALSGVSQNVNIPDANFKAALVADNSINTNMDSEIQVTEAQAYTGAIDVQGLSISDYTGLEEFINITSFDGKFNDVSSIDVSALTKLVTLDLGANTVITTLDVSTNILLETLNLAECFALTNLTFGNNTALATLSLREAGTTTVDFSNLTALKDLDMNSTGLGTTPPSSLDFSNNVNLETVVVRHSNVTSLDFSNNNKLTSIEVDFNSMMTTLSIKNGANALITQLIANNNASLTSICVDDVTFATNQAGWNPGGATYTASCTLSNSDVVAFESQVVFQNPVKNEIDLQLNSGKSVKKMKVFNLSGKEIMTSDNATMSVQRLNHGLYLLYVESNAGEVAVKKFIKI